ncbi:hypothetical protein [Legionella fairfieldensis]|nr:hypothetical protein [Legionella fairfieldensis]
MFKKLSVTVLSGDLDAGKQMICAEINIAAQTPGACFHSWN